MEVRPKPLVIFRAGSEAYTAIWLALVDMERDADMGEDALEARVPAGLIVTSANIHVEGNKSGSLRATWDGCQGLKTKVREYAILSRSHAYIDGFTHPLLVCAV